MTYPVVTGVYAAVLALIYAGLSGWVIGGRVTENQLHGDGGGPQLARRIRIHANFAEYVPFTLLLIALLEMQGAGRTAIHVLLIALLAARVAHPFGMLAPENSPRQFACRGGGIIVTLLVMAAAAVMLLARAL